MINLWVSTKDWKSSFKRILDVVVVLTILPFTLPVMALIALLIKLHSPGPVLFVSERMGRRGRRFRFLKFRTMHPGAHSRRRELNRKGRDGHIFKLRKDPRITPLGSLLRRASLDELPQLFNVLRGEMSVVGPRPLPVDDVAEAEKGKFRQWARVRKHVPPGITGLWQVSGRSDLPFRRMTRLDRTYIRRWSLGLDAKILFKTLPAVLGGKGAY